MNLKRALLTTTSATALCIGLSHADHCMSSSKDHDISIGGTLEAQSGSRYQPNTQNLPYISPNNKYIAFDTSASMHGSVKLFTTNGWTYGAQFGLRMATLSNDPAGKDYLDRTYMYIERPNTMRLELGTNRSAANAMKINAGSVAVATGGVSGAWTKFASVESYTDGTFTTKLVDGDNFIKSPKLVLKEGELEDGSSHERYRKITVYLPLTSAIKLGVSYGPDGANLGGRAFIPYPPTGTEKIRSQNPISVGLGWEHAPSKDEVMAASVVGEYAKYNSKPGEPTFNDYKGIMVGASYQLGKMSFAGSYGNHFKSKFSTAVSDSVKNVYVASAGAAYDFGKSAASLTYLYSDQNTNILHVVSAGVDYKFRKNFTSYLELTYFNADQKNSYDSGSNTIVPNVAKNSGTALILGSRIVF